jgi:aminoglycoside 2'-N-acetyltransferase I
MTDTITLETAVTRDISAELRAAIIAMCIEAHDSDFSPLFNFLPEDGLHVLAYQNGVLIGHAVRTTRWAQPAGHPILKTAYIDAVTARKDLQGQGIGSLVMRKIAELIAQEDYILCALESDKPGFYTRLGWEVWPGPLAGRKDGELIPTPEAQGNVLILRTPRTPPLDLNGLLSIEAQGRIW